MSASSVAYEYCQRLIHRFAENRKTVANKFKRSHRHQADNAMVEPLENRILLSGSDVAVAYVDDDWAALSVGVDPDGVDGPAGEIGVDAFASIQDAIDNLAENGTIHVADGTYNENLSITQNLTLLSDNGRDVTFINGLSGEGALGAITISNATTGVQIGDIDQGFSILGIDNGNAAVENAAVYLQGAHSGMSIIGNDIIANGDHGLLTEYSAAVTNMTVDSNIFSGQTFTGVNPGGEGFSQQFSLANVPRQLVAFGGGAGSSNNFITFTNNDITGTAGGINIDGDEQGNTLVTIDAQNSTITGNTFEGTTTRYGAALRARGTGFVTLTGNTFDNASMGQDTDLFYLEAKIANNNTFEYVVDQNDFTGGAYINGTTFKNSIKSQIEHLIEGAPNFSTITVLAGEYDADVTITQLGLKIYGPNYQVAPDAAERGDEAIINGGFRVQGNGTWFDGLTVVDGVGPAGIGDITAFHIANGVIGARIANTFITGSDVAGSRGIVASANASFNVLDSDISHWATGVYVNPNEAGDLATINNNNIHDNNVGISADATAGDVSIYWNFFADNAFEHIGLGAPVSTPDILINSFDANSPSVSNYGGTEVNASYNWWGTTDLALISSNMTANASGPVDFSPILNNGVDGDTDTYGFQNEGNAVTAHQLGSQTDGLIEEAINLQGPGSTVNLEGNYTGDVTIGNGIIVGGDFTLDGELILIDGATLAPGNSPAIVNVGGLAMSTGETLEIELFGTTAGTEHDQVNVTGTVDITNATLDLTLGYYPSNTGDSFTIINNDDVDAIVGTFTGLAEGATFTLSFGGVDFDATITYVGGDGNDVVITTDSYAVTDVYVDDDWAGLAVGDDPDGVGPLQGIGFDAFANIQDAIDAVDAGGTVHIAAGDYDQGTIDINKDGITLLGAQVGNNASSRDNVDVTDETVIHGTIYVNHDIDGTTIDGLFMQDFTVAAFENFGVFVAGGAANTTVQNVYFQGTDPEVLQNGIVTSIAGTTNNTFTQNVYDNTFYGVYLNPNSVGNEISDSLITNTRIGYVIDTAENTTVTGNTFDSSTGVYFWDGGSAGAGDNTGITIENNTFQNGTGVRESYVTVNDPGITVDLSNNTFDGKLPSAMSLSELFDLEDKITHAIDDASYDSLGIVVADNLYVTQLSGSIQNGIDAATAGDTLHVQAGTFTENLTVDKTLQIIGAGSGLTILEAGNDVGINVTAGGTSAAEADRMLISGMTINNEASMGIVIDGTVSYITIDDIDVNVDGVKRTDYGLEVAAAADVTDLLIDNSSFSTNDEGAGMHVHGSVDGLTITDSEFEGNNIGFYAFQVDGSNTILNNVNISGSSFSDNTYKGMYIEKLSNALLDSISVNNAGTLSGTTDGLAGYEVWPTGIDLNLKYYDYENITIQNSYIVDSGSANPDNGAGLAVKTRDDGSYATHPATLDGLTITGNVITGAQTNVRFGEPGKNNTGITNLTFTGNDLSGFLNKYAIANETSDTVSNAGNYFGTISIRGYDGIKGITQRTKGALSLANWANADLTQTYTTPTETYVSTSNSGMSEGNAGTTGGIYGYNAFTSINDAANNSHSQLGVTYVDNGTYVENVHIQSLRTLTGEFTLNGNLLFSNSGTLAPGNSPGIINTGNLDMAAGSTLEIEIEGATAGTGYDQVNVTGTVDIDGVILDTTFGYYPSHAGDSFTIINNDASDAIVGTFDGLAEGASLTLSHGGVDFNATISYVGGDGNDVVITTDPYTLDTVYVDDDWAGLALGDDPDGAGPLVSFGYDAFANLNDALNAVTDGGTINVLAGSYDEKLTITKSVNLLGANAGIHAAVGTNDSESVGVRGDETIMTADNKVFTISADDVTIDGFMFTGEDHEIIYSNTDAHGFHLTNSVFEFSDYSETSYSAVVKFNTGNHNDITVDFNSFNNISDYTLWFGNGTFDNIHVSSNYMNNWGNSLFWTGGEIVDGVIEYNEIDGYVDEYPTEPGLGTINIGQAGNLAIRNNWFHDTMYTPIQVGMVGGSITNNVFERIHSYSYEGTEYYNGAAIQLWGGTWNTPVATDVTISGNIIYYNDIAGQTLATNGIQLNAPDDEAGIDGSTIHIFDNLFVDGGVNASARALIHNGDQSTTLDADANAFITSAQLADLVTGPVDFSYMLGNTTDTDPGTMGFQPDYSYLIVHAAGDQTDGNISEALGVVDAGGLVEVLDGTYNDNITVDGTTTLKGTFTLNGTMSVADGATFAPGNSPAIVNTGDFSMTTGTTLEIELDGPTVGSEYDQVNVTGTVDITDATLDVALNHLPSSAGEFIIVNNDGADAVVGTFDGLTEGDTLTIDGIVLTISYVGGDGNDISLSTASNFDVIYVDDDWTGTGIGTDPDAGGPGGIYGVNAFDNINDAMDAVNDGGSIYVLAGSYNEGVSIDKSVNLLGANADVDPTNGGIRNAESTIIGNINIIADDVVFNGFELTGYSYNGLTIGGQVSNVEVSNNHLHDSIGGNTAILLAPDAGSTPNGEVVALTNIDILNNLVVTNSSINNQVGIRFSGPAYTHDVQYNQVTLDGNEITGTGVGHYGIFAGGNPAGYSLQDAVISNNYIHDVASGINVGNMFNGLVDNNIIDGTSGTGASLGVIDGTISNNTFANIGSQLSEGGTAAMGIWGTEYGFTATTNATITGNVFNFNTNADANITGVYTREGADSVNIHINENSFVNGGQNTDAKALLNWSLDGGVLDASNNWWSTTDASEIAALVADSENIADEFETPVYIYSGPVDFSPFLESGTDIDGSTAGFQGDFSALTVHNQGAQSIGLIQEGIDDVDVAGTVTVLAGEYVDTLTIDKQLTLTGAGSGDDPASNTVVSSPNNLLTISEGGSASDQRLVIENMYLYGHGSNKRVISVTGDDLAYITLDNLSVTHGSHGIDFRHTGTVTDLDIINSNFFENYQQNFHQDTGVGAIDDLYIANSKFNGSLGEEGFYQGSAMSNLVVEDSEFNDNSLRGMALLEINGADITRSEFDNNGVGILLYTVGNDSSDINITNSWITNNGYGVYVGGSGGTTENVTVNGNNISGNTTAMGNAVDGLEVDASNNWWGTTEIATLLTVISSNVDFSPYLESGTDTDLGTPGFQGVFDALTAHLSGTQTTGNINEALNEVNTGGTVHVLDGTYTEDVTVDNGVTLAGSFDLDGTLSLTDGAQLLPGNSPGIISTGNFAADSSSTVGIELDGPTAGTEYDQLQVTGTVDITDATLDLSLNFLPTAGEAFTMIDNDGADAVVGTFAGLAEGATIVLTDSDSGEDVEFTISYVGGDGNDVVLSSNKAPTANNVAINATEDGPAVVGNFDGSDPNPTDPITYQLVDLPANGTVINNNDGTFSYTAGDLPNLNNGETKEVTFTYKVVDSHGEESSLATVTVTISGVTEIPDSPNTYPNGAVDDAYTTSDVAIDIDAIANDTDPDGDTLHIHSVDLTSNLGATVSLNPDGTVHYEPGSAFDSYTPGDVILDYFRYELQDPYGNVDITRVNIYVTVVDAVNDAPVAQNVSGNAVEDGPAVTLAFNADDQDSDDNPSTLTYSIVSTPAVGSVINNGDGTFSYTAGDLPSLNTGQSQQVTFTYKATDSHGVDSNVATVTITIAGQNEDNPDNDAPVAQNVAGNVSEDGPAVNVSFNADDVDSDDDPTTLVYTITSTPANGVLINNGDGTFSFDPDGDFESLTLGQSQNVVFTYIATDSHGVDSNTATVTLTVIGANETTPANNQYPNGAVDSTSTQADVAIDIDVLDNDSDPDGDSLSVQSLETLTSEAGVPLTINPNGTIAYDPTGHFDHLAPGEIYRDTFRYTLTDPYGYADTTRVFVYVTGVDSSTPNASPTVGYIGVNTHEDLSVTFNFAGNDVDDAPTSLTYNILSSPTAGSVTNNGDGTFTFNPGSDFQALNNGETDQVTFTYQAIDPHGAISNTATVTITIQGADESSGENNAPLAQSVFGGAVEDGGPTNFNFIGNDIDSDDDPSTLIYTILSSPSEGSVINNNDGTFTFNPGSGFQDLSVGQTRQVGFSYQVTDSHGAKSGVASIFITVTGTNDYPTGVPNLTQTTVDQPIDIDVLSNDFDIDGDTLSTASVDAVSELGVSLSVNPDGTIHYDPSVALASLPEGTTVRDSFRYNLTDPYGNQDRTRVFIDVTAESITIVPFTAGLGSLENSAPTSLSATAPTSLANTIGGLGIFGSNSNAVSQAVMAWANQQASLKPTAPAMRLGNNISLSQGDDDSDSDNNLKLILVSEDVETE